MGLDQWWFTGNPKSNPSDFARHRKVPALEAYMAEQWRACPDYDGSEFNCKNLPITEELLNNLTGRVKNRTLDSEARGLFWGNHYEHHYDEIMEAVNKARAALSTGTPVYYTSWW